MKQSGVACKPRNSPLQIAKFFGTARIKYALQRNKPQQWGQWVRKELTSMGPAFIKMGQFLSTRSDLFDKEIVGELAKLQDDITPVHIDAVKHVINESYNKPWYDIFETIEDPPIACASIGQVHIATLKSTKEKVVIKVQKPCVAQEIRDDITTLKDMNDFLSGLGSSRATEVENVLQQYERFLSAELNYLEEMQHMVRFRRFLEDSPVLVPKVYKDVCTSEVLVMEYVPSTKIDNISTLKSYGLNTKELADNLVTIFLQMMINHGYVHCDPHPGNVGVTSDGDLVLYDFGNVITLPPEFRKEVNNIIFAVYQKDVDEFVDILLKLKVFMLSDDIDTLEIRMFFRSFFEYLETLDFKALQVSIKNQTLLSSYSSNFTKMKVDPNFLALFRVFSLLDGTCSKLDPNFNYIDSIAPFTQDLFSDVRFFDLRIKKDIEKLSNVPRLIRMTEQTVIRTQKQVNRLNNDVKRWEYVLIGVAIISQMEPAYAIPAYALLFAIWRFQA